jgi:hypothetical protein
MAFQYAGRSIYFQVRRLWQNYGKSLELARLGLDVTRSAR